MAPTLTRKEKEAVERLCENYSAMFLFIIMKDVNNKKAAEEILQEAFLKFCRILPNLESLEEKVLKAYIIKIIKRLIIDIYRKKGRKTSIESHEPFLLEGLEKGSKYSIVHYKLLLEDAKKYIENTFSPFEKAILEYRYQQELSAEEVGVLLGKKTRTIQNKGTELRKKIHEFLFKNKYLFLIVFLNLF